MKQLQKYKEHLTILPNQFFHDFQEKLEAEFVKSYFQKILNKFEEASDLQSWQDAIRFWNEFKSHLHTHFTIVELAFQCHTNDKEIEAEEKRLREDLEPIIEENNAKIRQKVLSSPHKEHLIKELGEQYFHILEIHQQNFHPDNIPLDVQLQNVLTDYTKLTGSASFDVKGKTYTLSQYHNFAHHPESEIREEAIQNYAGWFLNNRSSLEDFYDRSIVLREKMARHLGYENYIPLAYKKMQRTDYGSEEVAAFRQEILDAVVPIANDLRQKQAKMLGKSMVSIGDKEYFPDWKIKGLKVPVDEQPAAALRVYERISPKLAAHFKMMLDKKLFDLEARANKAPGAFCTSFEDYRVPFIFLNSVDEASDVTTVLHECGHSFQSWESASIDWVELRWPTLEACEVHSMGMEFLAFPYYEEFFYAEDVELFRKRHLAESILILPYIAIVDEFQHLVYGGEGKTAEARGQIWQSLEDKYMPGLDFSAVPEWKNGRWLRQLHIFKDPFYYIDYAIAQVGAWQLWVQSQANHQKTIENYLELCRLGGTLPLKKFFIKGGLKLPFEKGMLKKLVEEILEIQPL